ncbi:MAG: septal ring lytic transglycosylase RlpA family protein, partial [Candidatus Obscuribacterales bacterium]|nr:septal ring lytic transglycosylase RlpA family protein [Candidatus Obscuribacterales bacterium]
MNLLRFQSLFMVLLFCFALMSITAPAAHAGLFSFIKRHLFSHSSSVPNKPSETHHRSSSRKTAHRSKQDNGQNLKVAFSREIPPTQLHRSKKYRKNATASAELAYKMPQDNSISSISNAAPPHGLAVLSHQQNFDRRVIESDALPPEKIALIPQTPIIQFTKQTDQVQNTLPAHKSPAKTKHQKFVVLTPKYQAPIPDQTAQAKEAGIHYLSIQKNYNDKDAAPVFDESVKPSLAEAPILSKMDDTTSITAAAQTATQKNNKDLAFSTRASWYGPGFDGKRTASGQRFNTNALTAASRTLKFGSQLLVANPATGKCCTVTIN